MSCKSESKYFSYLSSLTVKDLKALARESGLYGYMALRKANLIRFLDRQSRVIKGCLEKRMFPDSMKAWIGLFADDNFAEHYTEVILHTLSDTSYSKKRKSVVPRKVRRRGRRRRNEVIEAILDAESSEDDIDDNWEREASDQENDNVSWYINNDDSDRYSDDEINDNDIKIWKEEIGI